jgi:hypothetical protein
VIAIIGAVLALLYRVGKLTPVTGAITVVTSVAIALVLRRVACRAKKKKAE